jgi:hypothetical protein
LFDPLLTPVIVVGRFGFFFAVADVVGVDVALTVEFEPVDGAVLWI